MSDISFLHVDLEISSKLDISTLIDELNKDLAVLNRNVNEARLEPNQDSL